MDSQSRLIQWGLWRRKLIDGAALPKDTVISRSMAGQIPTGANERRSNRITATEYCIDIDRRVAALQENLRRVVIAEYVIGGDVESKINAAGMPTSTYYRNLEKAKTAFANPRSM
tara:strand:- start:3244 stop:3588 length:345 start_codon:yes stop_codon:yes gene_type:complete